MSMSFTLNVPTATQARIESLAAELNRPAEEVATEALENYVMAMHHFDNIMFVRMMRADTGHFAPDQSIVEFFSAHSLNA